MGLEQDEATTRLRKRLEGLGWGLLLVWTGALILMPGDLRFLWYVWLAGVGAILLAFAALGRWVRGKLDWDGALLGAAAAISGCGGLAGLSISVVGLTLGLFGLAFLVRVATLEWSRPGSGSPVARV